MEGKKFRAIPISEDFGQVLSIMLQSFEGCLGDYYAAALHSGRANSVNRLLLVRWFCFFTAKQLRYISIPKPFSWGSLHKIDKNLTAIP